MFDQYFESRKWNVIFPVEIYGEPIVFIYKLLKSIWVNNYDKWAILNQTPTDKNIREVFEYYKDKEIVSKTPIRIRAYVPHFYLVQIVFDEDERVQKCFTLTRISDTVIQITRRQEE